MRINDDDNAFRFLKRWNVLLIQNLVEISTLKSGISLRVDEISRTAIGFSYEVRGILVDWTQGTKDGLKCFISRAFFIF